MGPTETVLGGGDWSGSDGHGASSRHEDMSSQSGVFQGKECSGTGGRVWVQVLAKSGPCLGQRRGRGTH